MEAVEAFARFYDVDLWLGTEHPKLDGFFVGRASKVWAEDKGAAVQKLKSRCSIDLARSIAIGDTGIDAAMLACVRYPICFNPDTHLLQRARMSGWPIVFERKDVICVFKPDADRHFVEVQLPDILPKELAKAMTG